jgi:uncharacterized phiE125 gp8 family phage protein
MKKHSAKTLYTAPTIEPVTLNEVKAHLRVTSSTDNDKISNLITTVRQKLEDQLQIALITQTWKAFYAGWPGEDEEDAFILPIAPVASVTHVKYKDTAGTQSTWSSAYYIAETDSTPGRVVLGYSQTFPTTELYPSLPIEIQFIAGYGAAITSVPQQIRDLLLIGIERLYNRPTDKYDDMLKDIWREFILELRVE